MHFGSILCAFSPDCFELGCQYQCNWLPGKTHLRNDPLFVNQRYVKCCSFNSHSVEVPSVWPTSTKSALTANTFKNDNSLLLTKSTYAVLFTVTTTQSRTFLHHRNDLVDHVQIIIICMRLMLWLQLQLDYDTTTIRLQRIARDCFQFDSSKKWTCQFFVVVVPQSNRMHIIISITSVDSWMHCGIVIS